MGPVRAIGRAYARMFNYSARASRSEFWWFFLFQTLVSTGLSFAFGRAILDDPAFQAALADPVLIEAYISGLETRLVNDPDVLEYVGYGALASFFLFFLPYLSLTVRRLHDTDRRGWFIFMPLLVAIGSGFVGGITAAASGGAAGGLIALTTTLVIPLLAQFWFFVVLCTSGTRGPNRFGGDPLDGTKSREPAHPAFAPAMDGEATDRSEVARKAAASDYYKRHVLPSIQKPQAQ
ncbi:DUF805 domain-containing protein [Gymnodinialimonas ulvae]|uniref:DUF805 domain-containing protein n=1 Tax=Gymnodinialimonas ulvae TaxID=3126504 RepID=UPI00309D8107